METKKKPIESVKGPWSLDIEMRIIAAVPGNDNAPHYLQIFVMGVEGIEDEMRLSDDVRFCGNNTDFAPGGVCLNPLSRGYCKCTLYDNRSIALKNMAALGRVLWGAFAVRDGLDDLKPFDKVAALVNGKWIPAYHFLKTGEEHHIVTDMPKEMSDLKPIRAEEVRPFLPFFHQDRVQIEGEAEDITLCELNFSDEGAFFSVGDINIKKKKVPADLAKILGLFN